MVDMEAAGFNLSPNGVYECIVSSTIQILNLQSYV